jgi:FkbM family methyltransferase
MIVRDNARTIEACLRSIKPWVDEVVVVDTGSKDETPRFAQRLGARLFRFPWCDDFSAARNESLRHARGEWVFWMDSDDTIDADCGRRLKELAARPADPSVLGYVMQVHCPGAGAGGHVDVTVVDHVKLFRNRPDLRFEGRIHEQILPAIRRAGGEAAWTDLFVVHSGYDHSPEGQQRKLERDLRLLHLELKERPDHPFTLFNLGMTYADVADYRRGAEFLRRSIAHSGPAESHLRKAYALLVYCEAQLGESQAAGETCRRGLELFPDDLELRFRKGILLHAAGRLREAAQAYEDILRHQGERYFTSVDRGMQGFKARQNLALVYTDLGDLARAEEQWRLIVAEVPGYRDGWHGLGDALLRRGKHAEVRAAAARLSKEPALRGLSLILASQAAAAQGKVAEARRGLERAVREHPEDPDALQCLCRLLFEHAGPAEAEGPLRELLKRCPDDAAAHHNLGTVYLRTGRPREAAESFRQSLRHRPDFPGSLLCLGYALQAGGRVKEAVDAWEQTLRLDPGNAEAKEALRQANPTGEKPTARYEARQRQAPPAAEATYTVKLRDRTVEISFLTRGAVDRAILQQVWVKDVYGVRDIGEAPAVVVDVGAHIGSFSFLAAESWPGACVIAAEADPDNVALLRKNLAGCRRVEIVEAAITGDDAAEVTFNRVVDKARDNSGGGSCVRSEPGTAATRVPALSAVQLWRTRKITRCDFLKLDCEGSEVPVLAALARAGLLGGVRFIVGEWHSEDAREQTRERVKEELRRILRPTHEVEFGRHGPGREGYFTAKLRRS